jgi:hypothetical protein
LINKDHKSEWAHQYGISFDSNKPELMKEIIGEVWADCGYEEGEMIDDTAIDPKYCPFCSGEKVDNERVLDYLLEKYKLNIKDVWKEMKG